ncbi:MULTISPECIES: hypothetical protein [Protofrankia]|uniref:Uncharacterized protein n=1 Tax=Candidatus Protofrankia datiscae TaxID=2716812 RepID=F8B5G9_9ACTN|nr:MULTISPECIES: hypothetical protein [Protofrankia]AEH08027.1 hypothetical protein FsymDg_0483 [Candidatus Protofrankia datiscae]
MERPYLPRLVYGLIQELLTELPDLRDYVELALRGGFPRRRCAFPPGPARTVFQGSVIGKHSKPKNDCAACNGSGTVVVTGDGEGTGSGQEKKRRSICNGTGKV